MLFLTHDKIKERIESKFYRYRYMMLYDSIEEREQIRSFIDEEKHPIKVVITYDKSLVLPSDAILNELPLWLRLYYQLSMPREGIQSLDAFLLERGYYVFLVLHDFDNIYKIENHQGVLGEVMFETKSIFCIITGNRKLLPELAFTPGFKTNYPFIDPALTLNYTRYYTSL